MITKEILEEIQFSLEMLNNEIKLYENLQITLILKYFGIPENKSEAELQDYQLNNNLN